MGLGKYLARKGAVGSTARWVAQGFWGAIGSDILSADNFKTQEGVDRELDKIVQFCLAVRFQNNPHHPDAGAIYNDWKIRRGASLLSFVEAILSIEASYDNNTPQNIAMFREVIEEELRAKKVGEVMIFGRK